MGLKKTIICLANSRKFRGRCIAGKELDNRMIGNWIRPIGPLEGGELDYRDIIYKGGEAPKILDIIEIPLLRHCPSGLQPENYLIDRRSNWVKADEFPASELPRLCDKSKQLWINGYHSSYGINDRVPMSLVEKEILTSLLFINIKRLTIIVGYEYSKRKVRAHFKFQRKDYQLVVTDPVIEREYKKKDNGQYIIKNKNIYLCISLGEPFESYCYKLVAGIIIN